jgi:O-antigen/teichoic acid export membrane protein
MLFANEIIGLAFGNEFIESAKMLTILSLIIIFRFSMYTYTSILSSSNLNYILIPIYSVYGAIVATVITEILLVVSFKLTSLKLVFTNYINRYEVIVFLITLLSLMIMINFNIALLYKILFLLLIIIILLCNIKQIKLLLNFKEMT